MADDKEYKAASDKRVASTRSKADWESRNRNFQGGSSKDSTSGAIVTKEISQRANDIAKINAKRAGADKKVGRKRGSK